MKISCKSTGNSLFVIIYFISFGCMDWKNSIVEVCLFCLICYQMSMEIYPQISFFFIGISYRNLECKFHCDWKSKNFYENIFQKYWELSLCKKLFHIFWMHGLEKVHCESLLLLFEIVLNFYWNLSKSQISCFFVEISYYNLENRDHCEYVSKNFFECIFQKTWQFSISNNLFHIFWTHGLEKINCWSLYVLFKIHQNLDWDPSKCQLFLLFCWNIILQLRKSKSLRVRVQKILWKHFSKVLAILYL